MTELKEQTLWGIPVVVTDSVPEGKWVFGRFPAVEEILEHGSFEKAIEAQAREWAVLTGVSTE